MSYGYLIRVSGRILDNCNEVQTNSSLAKILDWWFKTGSVKMIESNESVIFVCENEV